MSEPAEVFELTGGGPVRTRLALAAHCHFGLGTLDGSIGKREDAREHLAIATARYREMGMPHWVEQAEAKLHQVAAQPRRQP